MNHYNGLELLRFCNVFFFSFSKNGFYPEVSEMPFFFKFHTLAYFYVGQDCTPIYETMTEDRTKYTELQVRFREGNDFFFSTSGNQNQENID